MYVEKSRLDQVKDFVKAREEAALAKTNQELNEIQVLKNRVLALAPEIKELTTLMAEVFKNDISVPSNFSPAKKDCSFSFKPGEVDFFSNEVDKTVIEYNRIHLSECLSAYDMVYAEIEVLDNGHVSIDESLDNLGQIQILQSFLNDFDNYKNFYYAEFDKFMSDNTKTKDDTTRQDFDDFEMGGF